MHVRDAADLVSIAVTTDYISDFGRFWALYHVNNQLLIS